MQSVFSNGGVIGATLDLTSTAEYTDHASGTVSGYLEPVYVGGGSWTATALSGSQTVTFPSLAGGIATVPSEGDVVFAAIGASFTTNTDFTSSWTELFDLYSNDTEDAQMAVYYKRMGATPDTSIVINSTGSNTGTSPAVIFHVWRNLDATNPIDASNSVSSTSSQNTLIPTFGPVTPVTEKSVILAIAAGAFAGTPSPYTSTLDNFIPVTTNDAEDLIMGFGSYADWTSGAYTPSPWTVVGDDVSSSYVSATIALRPAFGSIPTYNKKNSGIWNLESVFDAAELPTPLVEYLVIAGGGGAGATANDNGGGGAGGYRSSVSGEMSGGGASAESPLSLSYGIPYTVTVGAGGASNTNGSDSVFASITSLGGGKGGEGGATTAPGASSGGSGGGGNNGTSFPTGAAGTAGQGFAGGNGGGDAAGGGGAGGVGGNGVTASPAGTSAGGAGVTSSITGTAVARAGGGGGGNDTVGYGIATAGGGAGTSSGGIGVAGTANTGGGGGGCGSGSTVIQAAGGSGVVIIRYPSYIYTPTISAGLTATTTTVGSNKVTIFTAGTGTVTF